MQAVVIKGDDNPIVIGGTFKDDFAASGFNTFARVELIIGDETYGTDTTPSQLFVVDVNELRLKIGATTNLAVGNYLPTIKGYSPTYPNGYTITGDKKKILDIIKVR